VAEQPPRLTDRPPAPPPRRTRRSHRFAPLAGLLLGLAGLVAIGWGVRTVADTGSSAPETTQPTTTQAALPTLRIVFPEGFTREDMAGRIAAVNKIARDKRNLGTRLSPKAYLQLTKRGALPPDFKDVKPPNLEGFLFPATYVFTPKTTTRELVAMQLEAFDEAWAKVDMRYAKSKNLTPYDVLIIASMIEKEVQVARERPLVAAVIYNRLKARMPLGIDATIRYGFHIPPTQAILESQIESNSPYNTRKIPGLPPTPIANPGLASIQAAAHPAKVDYLYFVRKADCKSHFFTTSKRAFDNYPRTGLQCG
jgi:uncharacterized YceG family protein